MDGAGTGRHRPDVPHQDRSMTPLFVLLALASGPTSQQGRIDSLLTAGDTARAITELRSIVRGAPTPQFQCRLAKLLTRRVTDRSDDWQDRSEAQDLFEESVRRAPDAGCLLAYAELRQKQHLTIEASRMASRAFELLQRNPRQLTPALRADFYYERARPIATWVRNFDHLVVVQDLMVST